MIYAWRGADREAVERELSHYLGGQLQADLLHCNWRSTPLLIDFFNRIVTEIFPGDEREEHQDAPPDKRYKGLSEIGLVKVKMEYGRKAPIYDLMIETLEYKKAEWGCDYSEITLLFRTNTEKEALAQKLSDAGIGFAEVKGRQILACEEGVSLFMLLLYLFAAEESGLVKKTLDLSSIGEDLWVIGRRKDEILTRYASPYGLKAISDVLEMCRGRVSEALLETFHEEAEAFFRADGRDAEEFLSYVFKVRNRVTVPEPAHSDRVKLATIHGTKGLEFPHVFLLWIEETRPFPFYVPDYKCHMSFNGDEIRFLEQYGTETSRLISEAHSLEKAKIERERANLLYVGVTRATHSITVFAKEPSNGKNEGESNELSRKLISIIEDGFFDARCIRTENSTFWLNDYGGKEEGDTREVLELADVSLPPPGDSDKKTVEIDRSRISRSIQEGIERGERIHLFLAGIGDRVSAVPARAMLSAEDHAIVLAFIDDPQVAEILFRPGKLYIEQPISNTDLYGVPDRMIVENDRITLIDFKTGTVGELLDSYREQAKRYGAIMKAIYPDRRIEAYLLLVDEKEKVIQVK